MVEPGDDATPPRAPARETVLEHEGDDARRPVVLAARSRRPRGARVPRGRERVHRGDARAPRPRCATTLYAEIVARVQETDASAPVRHGPYEYFTRTIAGQQYDVHCRRPAGTRAGSPTRRSRPGPRPARRSSSTRTRSRAATTSSRSATWSRALAHDIVAYTVDTDGGERYELRFRDVARRSRSTDVVEDVYYGLAFANDDRTVLFVRPDDAMRPWQVWRHTIGTPAADDVLVYQEDDERFFVSVERSRSGRVLVVTSASKVTTEVRLLDADDPTTPALLVGAARARARVPRRAPRAARPATSASTCSRTRSGENFGLFVTDADQPRTRALVAGGRAARRCATGERRRVRGRASWCRSAPTRTSNCVCSISAPTGRSSTTTWSRRPTTSARCGSARTRTGARRPCGTATRRSSSRRRRSTTTPRRGSRTLVKQQPVPGYDPTRYESERRWATAPDGAQVPISLVWRARLGARRRRRRSCSTGTGPTRCRSTRCSRRRGEPARPRRRVRDRARPRRRRARSAVVRGRQVPRQAQHLHRLRRVRTAPRRHRRDVARAARRARRQRGRTADGRGREPRAASCSARSSPRCPSSTA